MKIGVLAKRSGCKVDAIRYLEKAELLPPPPRSLSGQRNYGEADVARVRFISRRLESGIGFVQLKQELELLDARIKVSSPGASDE